MKAAYLTLVMMTFMAAVLNAQSITESLNRVNSTALTGQQGETAIIDPENVEDPSLKSLVASFDLMTRPEDFISGNFLAPRIMGSYSESILKADEDRKYYFDFLVNVNIQSPQTTSDTTAMLKRFLASGAVGSLNTGLKLTKMNDERSRGVNLAGYFNFSWQNSQVLNTESSEAFGYISGRGLLTAWTGPIIVTLQTSYYNMFTSTPDFITREANNKFIWNLMFAVKIADTFYLQGKVLLSEQAGGKESFEVSFVKSLDSFLKN